MRSEYKRDVHNNYLVLESDKYVEETSYPVRMLLANALPLFLKCRLQGMNGKMLFSYEITSKQSLGDFYEKKKFTFEDLHLIFENFIQLIEKMAEYLLNPDQLVLQPEFIFLDAEKKQMYFCYLPGYERPIREQFQSLTEYILPKLDHEDSRAVMLGYGIYRRALEEMFQLEHIKEEVYHGSLSDFLSKGEKGSDENFFGISEIEKKDAEDAKRQSKWKEEDGFDLEEQLLFVGAEEKSKGKAVLLYGVGCIFAVGILFVLLFAQQQGYIPRLGVEANVGILILLLSVCSLIGYFLQKTEKKEETENKGKVEMKEKVEIREKKVPDRSECTANRKKIFVSEKNGVKQDNDREYNETYYIQEEKLEEKKQKKAERIQRPFRDFSGNYGETVVLCEEPVSGPATLVSKEPGALATIYLQEELTVVGKMENAADVVIDLPTVSRIHAKIRKRGEDYYLTDLNSRNGTAVNGRMLKAEEEYLLQEEDEVDFAQARYIFLK